MEEDYLDEEFSIMYRESGRTHVLDSNTLKRPVRNLKVRKPMVIDAGQTLQDAISVMQSKKFGCLLVTSEGSRLAGILTERDILMKALGEKRNFKEIRIREIMTPDPESVQPDDSIAFVMNAMHVGGYRHVPVVDERHVPVAVVSVKDIVAFIVENFPEEILNLPPKTSRQTPQQNGG